MNHLVQVGCMYLVTVRRKLSNWVDDDHVTSCISVDEAAGISLSQHM